MRHTDTTSPQGRFLGIPYDWRWPSLSKIKHRIWAPGASMLRPKVFGYGWTLNFAHPGSWLLLAATVGPAIAVAILAS